MAFVAHFQRATEILLRGYCYPPVTSQQNSLSIHQQRGRTAQLTREAEVKAEQFPCSQGVAYHRLSAFQDNKTSTSHTSSLPQACLCIQIFGSPSPCKIKHSPEAKFFSKHLAAFDLRSSWCTAAPHYFCSSQEHFAFSCPPLQAGIKGNNITSHHLSFSGKSFYFDLTCPAQFLLEPLPTWLGLRSSLLTGSPNM